MLTWTFERRAHCKLTLQCTGDYGKVLDIKMRHLREQQTASKQFNAAQDTAWCVGDVLRRMAARERV